MIYSKSFLIKCRDLDVSILCPVEISNMKIEIINNILEIKNKNKKNNYKTETLIITKVKNSLPPDIKRITGILNKITDDNYDKMIEEARTFNHASPEVVTYIFKKIILEPFFSDIYAKFCNSLEDLHEIINERCIIEFDKTKHKNLGKFIGELYKIKLLKNIDPFINILMDNIDDNKLETLCKIIMTIGVHNKIFNKLITNLDSIKNNFKPRYKFMILDIIELKQKKI